MEFVMTHWVTEGPISHMEKFLVPAGLLWVTLFAVLSSVAFKLAYNIHFHPLSKFPGPTLFAASRLLYIWHLLRGTLVDTTVDLHKRYGKVVRIAPDELSFSSGDAWKQIYGNQQGRPQRPKDKRFYTDSSTGTPNIILGSDKEHSRFRRILSHAFSETALRAQESLMQKYVNLMIQRLHENAARGAPLDMVEWYNFTTFDMIGDLTFGQPFGCLENSKYHSWVAMIFGNIKLAPYLNATKRVPGLQNLLSHFLPKELVAQRQEHHRLTNDIVQKRLSQGNGRPDFMSEILKHNDPKTGMNAAELVEHAEILIIAGSETTATLLCGVTYYLLRNPHVLQKLAKEIRDAFITEEEINITAINGLEYTLAVLNEGLRMYPPVPSGLPRLIKTNGGIIGGSWVPAGTVVSVTQMAAYRSPDNFHDPDSFIPERFLGTDKRFESDDRNALQPFSTGPRNCIGRNLAYAEMRLILARLVWNFDLVLDEQSKDWAKQKVYFLWEKGPLEVRLTPVKR